MRLTRCEYGHYYDADRNVQCPHCAQIEESGRDPGPTMSVAVVPNAPSDDSVTLDIVHRQVGQPAVVGWLVCVQGPDKGKDFRLSAEKNRVGRGMEIEVGLTDRTVSRGTQAIVSYDPRRNAFHAYPGDGRGLVYLNGGELTAPTPLNAYDVLETGESRLLFIPFCGEAFSWQ